MNVALNPIYSVEYWKDYIWSHKSNIKYAYEI